MDTFKPQSGEATIITSEKDMASVLFTGCETIFPEVFATSRMIALMELAAAKSMQSVLPPDHLSVGVVVRVKHFAATPKNAEVKAIATFKEMEGKLYKFIIEAFDEGGKIGEGEHSRAIIEKDRLINGAKSRAKR
jgi:fluoroacetyl-CoA thioesterase